MVKVGDTLKHKASGATLEVTRVSPTRVVTKVITIGPDTPSYIKVGQSNTTSPAVIERAGTYEVVPKVQENNLPPGYESNDNQLVDDINDEILLLRKQIPPEEFKPFWIAWQKGELDDLIDELQASGEEPPSAAEIAQMLYTNFKGEGEAITEDNVTANLDGGAGQPKTPFAFGKKGSTKGVSIGKASKSFTEPSKETHRWTKKFESLTKLAGLESLDEVSYRAFKTTEGTEKQKINLAIKEAYRKVLEAEKIISNASKLKMEVGANQNVFWKQSSAKFQKLAERLTRLSTTLREFNK